MATRDTAINVDDDDDDEDLRLAIELSLQKQPTAASRDERAVPSYLQSLNRKQMEIERLARLSKKRTYSADAEDDPIQTPPPPPPKRHQAVIADVQDKKMPFTKGVVKKTWVQGYPRRGDDVKIEEVLQRDQLELAVISSFQWDEEWMLSKLNLTRTKLLLVAFAGSESQKQAMRENVPPGIRFCFPPMNGPGAMHSKLQLLKFPDHLRIAVPTGNFVPYDWGESGVLENMVFLIDLPRLTNSKDHEPTKFSENLKSFLKVTGLEHKLVESLDNYDFSATKTLGFAYSFPGTHHGTVQESTGYCGLGQIVTQLGLATSEPIEVDLLSASLGSLKYDFIQAMYNACQGDSGLKELNLRVAGRAGKQKSTPGTAVLQNRCRVYFPTRETVMASKGGSNAAGTICFQEKWWASPGFPAELLRKCVNRRAGLLTHSKLILVRSTQAEDAFESPSSWAYCGSANLSESAWGRLTRDKSSNRLKMNIRNWECGVVIPTKSNSPSNERVAPLAPDFGGVVPVPMEMPSAPYQPNDKPWFAS